MLLYRLVMAALQLATRLAARWHPKARLQLDGRRHTLAIISTWRRRYPDRKVAWIHCASLGEYEQGAALLQELRATMPHVGTALSFYSPSGYEVMRDSAVADMIFYLPIDLPGPMQQLVDTLVPSIYIMVKYDYWYQLLQILQRQEVPQVVVAARYKESSTLFRMIGKPLLAILSQIDRIYVQTTQDRDLLTKNGIQQVVVGGDTRVDSVLKTAALPYHHAALHEWHRQGGRTIIYGSVWPDDLALVLPYIRSTPQHLHIIAPHDIDHLEPYRMAFPQHLLWTAHTSKVAQQSILLMDTIGALKYLYRYADLAYIGGGLHGGLHNTLEPAAYHIPIIVGPDYHDFVEVEVLIGLGVAASVRSSSEFAAASTRLLEGDKAERTAYYNTFFADHSGNVAMIIDYIRQHV